MTDRGADIERFYELMGDLEDRVGGKRKLSGCHRSMGWPERGVYFFFEDGETRANHDTDLRVVRVGTHAVTARSKSRLWHRLYEHKQDGGRSVFRDHVNRALKRRLNDGLEHNHSRCISTYIGQMPFLWVSVDGENSHRLRTRLEKNAIALLSFWRKDSEGNPSHGWLGRSSTKREIKQSGLWNIQHVKGTYDLAFLDDLANCIDRTEALNEPPADWHLPVCLDRNLE